MNTIKPCKSCNSKWPYVFVVFLATFVSLLTWLTLATEDLSTTTKVTSSLGAFFVVSIILLSYVVTCLRRHCGHDSEHAEVPQ
uniref:Uncharacterized protein n=1 Tax=Candidatus Kentrum eta TaxID=2126337 RepID=A0A450UQD0_9GAMM|nr:MAG: hypothetical protein BECKH772A_GA0070896_1007514 [Candidatus Kentron sp. H]VFJ94962.1 MAG: hypothetical protein BECKH772B_GA0070898_1006914 [Candidatus Kentron sp. H]VFK01833.1 MAG: hypothetical protein BECKH772C_GA0070978_1007314 [Candidatus Kentron sp. H]